MEGDIFSVMGDRRQVENMRVSPTVQKGFVQVEDILDQNRLLINEINQNHQSKVPENLTRNVGLIRELNNNIRTVVNLYGEISSSYSRFTDASSEAESTGTLRSDGKASHKRLDPVEDDV